MNVGELVAYLKLRDSGFSAQLAKAKAQLKSLGDEGEKGLGRLSGGLDMASRGAAVFAGAGLVPTLLGVAGAATTAAGAVGLLPAVAGAAAFGVKALSLATDGFGDALAAMDDPAKFAEALAKLSPNAREAALAVKSLVPAWDAMKQALQDRLFDGVGKDIQALGNTYIPILESSFGRVVDAVNDAGHSVALMLTEASRVTDVTGMLSDFAGTWENLTATIGPLSAALVDIGVVGGEVLRELTEGAGGAAQEFQRWIAEARKSGELKTWILEGVQAVKDLGAIVGNVFGLIRAVLQATNTDGAGLLTTLRQITEQALAWAKSAEGQQQLAEIMGALREVASALGSALLIVAQVVASLVMAFASLPAPVQTVVASMFLWAKILAPIVSGIAGLVTAATTIGPALLLVGRHFVTAGAAALAFAGRVAMTAVTVVAQMAVMAAGAMARAAVMAAAWVVAMGPVGWVIAAVVALVALIVANWDTVKQWTITAWEAVSSAVSAAWDAIVSWVTSAIATVGSTVKAGWDAVVATVKGAWDAAVAAVKAGIDAVVTWVKGLPQKILSALASLNNLLVGLGRDMVNGLWNGIKAGWSWLTGQVQSLAQQLLNAAKSALGIGSPSKKFRDEVGKWVGPGAAVGVKLSTKHAVRAVKTMSKRMQLSSAGQLGMTNALPGAGGQYATGTVRQVALSREEQSRLMAEQIGQQMRGALTGCRLEVDGRGVARLVNRRNQRDYQRGGHMSGRR